jgi:hypothetical protein
MESLSFLGNDYLGADFSISSTLWLIAVFTFMFAFRKKIFPFLYKDTDMDKFLIELKEYLKKTYPKIKFDYQFLDTLVNEPNPDAKKYALIDNIINQYISLQFNPPSQKSVPTNLLWSSYAFDSKPNGDKLPEDWLKRKNVIYDRDYKTCQRCSKEIHIKDADLFLIKPLNKNGNYYLENLILVCTDCAKIEKNKIDSNVSVKYLQIKENLYSIVK